MTRRAPHPFVYTLLIVPFGAVSGFVSVALGFLATKRGLTVEEGATLIAVGMIPHTWKFLWGPVVDTTLSRKAWYVLSSALCALGVLAMASVPLSPANLLLMQGVIVLTNVATTTLGMAVEGFMAHVAPVEDRGRTGGWFQAGNLGGAGVGGGFGLWMASNLPAPWMSGAVLAGLFAACGLALRWLPEVPAESRDVPLPRAIGRAGLDLLQTIRSREGMLAGVLCFLPIGTGAALGVLAQADVAAQWGAGETEVGLVNGVLAGVLTAGGCLAGGWLCSRFPSKVVYAAVGALMAGVALAMAAAPQTPTLFVVFGIAYSLVTGLAFAAFTGFVLEVIGAGAAATKYNAFASLSNTPIMYMGLVLASAVGAYGVRGMLVVEALAGFVGIAALGVAARVLRPRADAAPVVDVATGK